LLLMATQHFSYFDFGFDFVWIFSYLDWIEKKKVC
jgi:hypothetical protein